MTARRERTWMAFGILGALFAGALAASFAVHARGIDGTIQALALESARQATRQVVAARAWNASIGGVYAPVDGGALPNPYLKDPHRDLTTTEGIQLTKVNPAYMTRLIAEQLARGSGVRVRLASARPINPGNAGDPWELSALAAFESGSKEASALEGTTFRYLAPLDVKESCLRCHAEQGYRVGDVRGGVSITLDYRPYATAAGGLKGALLRAHLVALAAGLLLLGAGALLLRRAGGPVAP